MHRFYKDSNTNYHGKEQMSSDRLKGEDNKYLGDICNSNNTNDKIDIGIVKTEDDDNNNTDNRQYLYNSNMSKDCTVSIRSSGNNNTNNKGGEIHENNINCNHIKSEQNRIKKKLNSQTGKSYDRNYLDFKSFGSNLNTNKFGIGAGVNGNELNIKTETLVKNEVVISEKLVSNNNKLDHSNYKDNKKFKVLNCETRASTQRAHKSSNNSNNYFNQVNYESCTFSNYKIKSNLNANIEKNPNREEIGGVFSGSGGGSDGENMNITPNRLTGNFISTKIQNSNNNLH